MSFISPIWLVGIVPWLGVTLWLLLGRRERTTVPFLPLWHGQPQRIRRRHAPQRLPLPAAATLVAVLLSLLAAADPVVPLPHPRPQHIAAIVDRGLTMSGVNRRGERRYLEDARILQAALNQELPEASIDWRIVPGLGVKNTGGGWTQSLAELTPTAVVDPDAIALAARQALRSTDGPVLVLSDQEIHLTDPRLIRISPPSVLENVAIETFSARIDPHPQAMVRLFNQSPLATAIIEVDAGGREISRQVRLPPAGQRRNYFLDLPVAAPVLEALVRCQDDLPLDRQAWLVRRRAWPRIEALSSLPLPLQRMIEVYTRDRPPSGGSNRIAVLTTSTAIASDTPSAIVPDENSAARPLPSIQPLNISGGPLQTTGVDWPGILADPDVRIVSPPSGNWMPIVSAAGHVVVAVQSEPSRQVWVGFHSMDFTHQADFVVFWSEIFDWLGSGAPEYAGEDVGPLPTVWNLRQPAGISLSPADTGLIPGLYAAADGALLAKNAPAPPPIVEGAQDWQSRLRAAARIGPAVRRLDGPLLLSALVLIVVAVLSWRGEGFGRASEGEAPARQSVAELPGES